MSIGHEDGATASLGELFDDFIDVSHMNFDNQETWLLDVNSDLKGTDNLQIWLKNTSGTEKAANDSMNDCRKFIDTRTWTRPKKRFSRLSFDSIIEVNSPNSLCGSENHCPNNQTRVEINLNERTSSIPSILRPSIMGSSNFSSSFALTSGQESLEAFLNMSQTKGVDSFINMEAPEFNETMISSKNFCSNTSSMHEDIHMNQSVGMVDSQILTESMMQTSMFSDISDVNINDAFARDLSNASVIENPYYQAKSLNATLVKSINTPEKQINATFTTEELHQALDTRSFVINNDTFDTDSAEINHLSYIVTSANHCEEGDLAAIEENEEKDLNSTFNTDELSNKEKKFDSTFISEESSEKISANLNSTMQILTSSEWNNDVEINHANNLQNGCLNSTYTSEGHQLNRRKTFRIEPENVEKKYDIPVNRFQTFKKNSTINRLKNPTAFTAITKNCDANFHTGKQVKSCENLLEIKKAPQIPRKLESNRNLSRLPQHLQKSNPNLVSNSLKTANLGRISHFGFVRQKQVKNNEPPLTRKVYSLAKLKSGSEQRLAGPKIGLEFSKAGGSTESIESTQSAASAPDFDDRLSVCSDESNSCRSGVKNETEPRRVLENTWFPNENNLPSPILKDGDLLGCRLSSSRNTDSAVKTSSPILSPAESLQTINCTTNHIAGKVPIVPPERGPEKTEMMAEKPKTMISGLRPPSARGLSGIPRPASRIPAPRFARPTSSKI